jgi:hypothetical protein
MVVNLSKPTLSSHITWKSCTRSSKEVAAIMVRQLIAIVGTGNKSSANQVLQQTALRAAAELFRWHSRQGRP